MHRKLYHQIVHPHNLDKLKKTISAELEEMGHLVINFEIRQFEKLPYIYCDVEADNRSTSDKESIAQMTGLLIKKHVLNQIILNINYSQPHYYLPIVVVHDYLNKNTNPLLSKERVIRHEIQHVIDIIDYIEQHPDYPENYIEYGMNGEVSIDNLAKSIDMEVSKLFYIEPRAMKLDYDSGEDYVLIHADLNKLVRFDCDGKQDYIGLYMKLNIDRIKDTYREKYSNNKKTQHIINIEIDKAINKYGKEIYGENPVDGLSSLTKKTLIPMMFAIARANE